MLDVELIPSGVSVSAPPPRGRVPDPGWRPQSHRRADPGLLPVLSGVVASLVHTRPRLMTQPSRVAQSRLQLPLPEARVVEESRGVHRPYRPLMAGVQRTLRSSLRVDVDESKDARVVCGTFAMNSGHYLWPETLGRKPSGSASSMSWSAGVGVPFLAAGVPSPRADAPRPKIRRGRSARSRGRITRTRSRESLFPFEEPPLHDQE